MSADNANTAGVRHPVVVQKWEESERGWGCRPDGYSIHATEADREKFIAAYWDLMPSIPPHEYSRPCGKPYIADVGEVEWRLLQVALEHGRFGTRMFNNVYPGDGGTDGWMKGAKL